jgi:arginase
MKPFEFIVAPTSLGASVRGGELGAYILCHELEAEAAEITTLVGPEKPSSDWQGIHNYQAVSVWNDVISHAVGQALLMGTVPILLGGDASVSIGSVRALMAKRRKVKVVWFAAHAPVECPESLSSGNLSDCALSWSLGYSINPAKEVLPTANVLPVGLRNTSPDEAFFLLRNSVPVVTAKDVADGDFSAFSELQASERDTHIHVVLDLNCLDPESCPNVNEPEWGGCTVNQLCSAITTLPWIDSADVVGYNPVLTRETEARSRACASSVIKVLLSRSRAPDMELPEGFDEDDPFH